MISNIMFGKGVSGVEGTTLKMVFKMPIVDV